MKKRIISIILAIIMVVGIIPWTAIPVKAANTYTLAELRAKYPAGYYWNHADNPGASNSVNNPGGVTSIPCSKHGVVGTSQQTCNGFTAGGSTQLSWQCMGYAEQLGYLATGYNPRNNANGWYTDTSSSALDNLKPGDIVRYKNNGHSIYVIGVNGDTVTYTDCNGDGHCIIRWDQTISKSTIRSTFTYVRSAPFSMPPETDDCEHWYTTWETVEEVAATCTEEGYWIEVEYCDDCGEVVSYETYYEDPLGHWYDWEIVEEMPATCTEAGYWIEVKYCVDCGEEFDYETYYEDPLGHDIWWDTIEEVEPTCTEEGYYVEVEYCAECGETLGYETYYEDPYGHEYEILEETLSYTLYSCIYCGDEYFDYNEQVYVWFEDYFYFICAVGEYVTIPDEIPFALGYNFGGWYNEEQDAVYMPGDGFYVYANTAFYAIWYEADALGNYTGTVSCPIDFGGAGYFVTFTPAESGAYVIEGADDLDTMVYLYDGNGNLIDSDDDSGEDYQFHLDVELIAGETYYIYVCFYNDWDAESLEWFLGLREEHEHEYVVDYVVEPDCYNEGYTVYICSACGSSYTDDFTAPTKHDFHTIDTYWPEDGGCGEVIYVSECSICGHILEYLDYYHTNMVWEIIDPTCEDYGYNREICYGCGEIWVYEMYDPLGHDYVDTVVAPTYEAEGYTLHTCQRCGDSYMDNFVDKLVPETDMLLQIGDVTAQAGELIEVPIYLSGNAGFSYLRLALEYDADIFEFVSATNGTVAVEDFTAGKNLLWVEAVDTMENGLLVTLTFLVKEDVTEGDYTIGAEVKECYNESYADVSMQVASGTVTIVNIMYGDVNGDGKVDGRDLLKLKRYLANYDDETGTSTEEITAGADVNGDGKVDGRDLLKLKRYLANYDDETGTSTEPLGPQP